MANTKSVIREINLENTIINLNKNKSIISDFNGFNKNTGVWYNGVLSNLYCSDDETVDDVITIDKDTFKIEDDALYKNDILIKDYSNRNKVKTEILGNIADNVIAYTPQVHIYYEGNSAYVRSEDDIIPVGTYDPSTIPYIIVDKEADTWCALYGNYAVCKGMTTAVFFSSVPTAAIYSGNNSKWYCVNINNSALISVQNTQQDVISLDLTTPIIDGAARVTGWTANFRAINLTSRMAFASIEDLKIAEIPTVTLNTNIKEFRYLKGFYIEEGNAIARYSIDGDAIDMSVVPDGYDIYAQPFTTAWSKLASIKTKFLSYSTHLAIPYSTVATTGTDTALSSVDGPTAYLLESVHTTNNYEFMTLSGSTAGVVNFTIPLPNRVPSIVGEENYPKLLGLFNENYSPEWLFTDIITYKLIYNRDALVGISKDNSIIVPWNDVDENTLTIVDDDIYYYSLNSNTWVHVNVSTANKLEAIKIGNNLLLNSTLDNCYDNKDNKLYTYSVDTSLADFVITKPRVGLINIYGIDTGSYINPNVNTNFHLGNLWLTYMLEAIKNADKYYLSIVGENDGPIWAAAQLLNYTKITNTRRDIWQFTATPTIGNAIIDYSYYLNNMTLYGRETIDAYTSTTGSVLSYFKSWYQGVSKYNNKLADTEKSLTEPTYYNLSPNIDIMTFIDGFNTIALIKVGNNTVQLLVKESELLLVYNLLSNVSNISDYFVLQGQQYGIINNYINKVDMVNGQVVAQTPITSVEGLKFLGNTDKQAFFFSQMNKTILYFAADNTLEFLMDATELDNNTTTVFAKQTNDIFVLLNDKVVVFTNSGSMYEILSRAEYITFGDNSWSDGERMWSYYKTNSEQKRVPIELETLWYGDTANRKQMNVDCVYVEIYDDNYMPGKFEISFEGLVNDTVSTKTKIENVREKDYDRVTKTYYLRYQPAFQNCAAFKLNIKSDIAIKRIAIGYTSEGISTISKNNI